MWRTTFVVTKFKMALKKFCGSDMKDIRDQNRIKWSLSTYGIFHSRVTNLQRAGYN